MSTAIPKFKYTQKLSVFFTYWLVISAKQLGLNIKHHPSHWIRCTFKQEDICHLLFPLAANSLLALNNFTPRAPWTQRTSVHCHHISEDWAVTHTQRAYLIFFPKAVPAWPQNVYAQKEACGWWQAERAKANRPQSQRRLQQSPQTGPMFAGQKVALKQRASTHGRATVCRLCSNPRPMPPNRSLSSFAKPWKWAQTTKTETTLYIQESTFSCDIVTYSKKCVFSLCPVSRAQLLKPLECLK